MHAQTSRLRKSYSTCVDYSCSRRLRAQLGTRYSNSELVETQRLRSTALDRTKRRSQRKRIAARWRPIARQSKAPPWPRQQLGLRRELNRAAIRVILQVRAQCLSRFARTSSMSGQLSFILLGRWVPKAAQVHTYDRAARPEPRLSFWARGGLLIRLKLRALRLPRDVVTQCHPISQAFLWGSTGTGARRELHQAW